MKIQLLHGNDKASLCLRFNLDGVTADVDFWRSAISETEMVLLQQHLQKVFGDHMEEIRRVAYARGYDDHKKRMPKRGLFARCHEVLEWEKK